MIVARQEGEDLHCKRAGCIVLEVGLPDRMQRFKDLELLFELGGSQRLISETRHVCQDARGHQHEPESKLIIRLQLCHGVRRRRVDCRYNSSAQLGLRQEIVFDQVRDRLSQDLLRYT